MIYWGKNYVSEVVFGRKVYEWILMNINIGQQSNQNFKQGNQIVYKFQSFSCLNNHLYFRWNEKFKCRIQLCFGTSSPSLSIWYLVALSKRFVKIINNIKGITCLAKHILCRKICKCYYCKKISETSWRF